MSFLEERRKRGATYLKKTGKLAEGNPFDAATDVIADILLSVAETQEDAEKILRGAEMDFRCSIEAEGCAEEG